MWTWHRLTANTTITAATVFVVVNNQTNSTSTSTVFADLPSGYTLPPLNKQGTRVTSFSWTAIGGEVKTTAMYISHLRYSRHDTKLISSQGISISIYRLSGWL